MSNEDRDHQMAELLSALGHPTRICLLRQLAAGACCVTELTDNAQCLQPKVSRHLAVLRRAGLVDSSVDGRRRCYHLTRPDLVASLFALLEDT